MPKFTTNILILLLTASLAVGAGPVSFAFAQPPAAPEPQPEADPADSPLLREPDSPEKLFEAINLMVKLGRPELAKRYLTKLVDAQPADDVLLTLRDEFGTVQFLRLSRIEALQPESEQLLEMLNAAARKQAEDPARMQTFIDDLLAGGQKRDIARLMLKNIGPPVVPMLLQRMSNTTDGDERDQLLLAILGIGDGAIPVLHGGLMSTSDTLKQAAIEPLGWLEDRTAVPFLWFPAFGNHDNPGLKLAARSALKRIFRTSTLNDVPQSGLVAELNRVTQMHLRNDFPWKLNEETGQVDLWQWDATTELLRPTSHTPQEASLVVGSHFASQAVQLSPEDRETQATFLALALAADYHRVGWDKPLPTGPGTAHDLALTSGPGVLTEALHLSLENTNSLSALASLQALSLVASQQQLQLTDSRRSPILAALNYPSHRVQFAAASTILQIDPDRKFPGSERVVGILSRALNDSRLRYAVIIDPDTERGDRWSTLLGGTGYQTSTIRTGRAGFTAVADRMDVELIAIHVNCIDWGLTQTVANLRADARTSSIPIIVYGPEQLEFKLQGLIGRTSLSRYLSEEITEDYLSLEMGKFLQELGTPDLTPELRTLQVSSAAYWLSVIASGQRTSIYNLLPAQGALINGTNDPEIAEQCLLALSAIPTVESQRALFDVAIAAQGDPATRQAAAYQLAFHVQRHSWLLDDRDIKTLEAGYQREVDADSKMATSLAAILGTLQPGSRTVGARLKEFVPPR